MKTTPLSLGNIILLKEKGGMRESIPRQADKKSGVPEEEKEVWGSPSGDAAAAAKSLQSCPTLCDPIDGSPPGSPVCGNSPGKNTGVGCHFLLQCMKVKSENEVAQSVWLIATAWTAAYQSPPSLGFSRQEYWSGVPLPSLGSGILKEEERTNIFFFFFATSHKIL